jgi:hypothetical protein
MAQLMRGVPHDDWRDTMSYTLDVLPGEPIILITLGEDFDIAQDMPAISRQYQDLAERAEQPINLIVDFSPARKALSVGSVIAGANVATKGEFSMFTHPKTKTVTLS